jgi:hypothetical protein
MIDNKYTHIKLSYLIVVKFVMSITYKMEDLI